MNQTATKDPETGKWKGYKPEKGKTPPWDPFNPDRRKNRLTVNERKFLYVLGKTGKLQEAYLASYKIKDYGNPILQRARINAMASQVLARLKKKAPELANAATFEDLSPDFVKKGLLALLEDPNATVHEKTRIYELFGKMNDINMFSDKHVIETKITEVKKELYSETDEDFPEIDKRLDRQEIDLKLIEEQEKRIIRV